MDLAAIEFGMVVLGGALEKAGEGLLRRDFARAPQRPPEISARPATETEFNRGEPI